MYQDETLTCRDCGKEFVFTASEQAFYAEKGFQNKPRRCPSAVRRSAPRTAAHVRSARCSPRSARIAARRPRFLSSRAAISRCTAAIASLIIVSRATKSGWLVGRKLTA